MKRVVIVFADGFEEVEAITPVDVLRRAGCDVQMVSITGKKEVTSTRGVRIIADALWEEISAEEADMIVLPGGQPGAGNLDRHEGLKQALLRFAQEGKWIAAICAAPLVPGHLGLLKGKKVTCFPGTEKELEGALCTGNPVESDGFVLTGKGAGVALPFSLLLVEKLFGKEKAEEIKHRMMA